MEIREIEPGESGLAFAAMRELRPTVTDETAFTELVDGTLRPQGYRLAGAFDGATEAAAVAGFRVADALAWGRYLYVDDLSTRASARRRGHARALMEWLIEEGRRLGCAQLHLDSAVGLDRADAHRLYLNCGLVIAAHHFGRDL